MLEDPTRADIVYLVHAPFSPSRTDFPSARFITSFPEETRLCTKDALARTVKQQLGWVPWLPRSFDSETELHIFCGSFFQQQQQTARSEPKLWIAKSRDLTRGMGHVVLESLPWLLRSREALPRVVCEYIQRPALLRARKFDVRFVVLVSSLGGGGAGSSECYLYNEIFPRIAAEPYTLAAHTLHRYDTQFTLAPHDATSEQLKLMKPRGEDFVAEFDSEHGGPGTWRDQVMPKVREMFAQLFSNVPLVGGEVLLRGDAEAEAAKTDYLRQRQRFRAMYGCDVMIECAQQESAVKSFQPKLLEVTFAPDSDRAVRTVPAFFDHVFNILFRGEITNAVKL
jgi:tubulin--tyrosine ligase-like protein 12